LNALLSQLYQLDPGAFTALQRFHGKVVQLQLSDLKKKFLLQITDTKLLALDEHSAGAPDLIIHATLIQLIRFSIFKDPIRQLQIQFQGDSELAMALQRAAHCYQGKPSDWLAHYIGDNPVLFGKRLLSGIGQFMKAPLITTCEQVGDYLLYETQSLAPKPAIDAFNHGVSELSLDMARLEVKVALLSAQIDALEETP
jgi:ubiquinone biosynthesis protein UbiJ